METLSIKRTEPLVINPLRSGYYEATVKTDIGQFKNIDITLTNSRYGSEGEIKTYKILDQVYTDFKIIESLGFTVDGTELVKEFIDEVKAIKDKIKKEARDKAVKEYFQHPFLTELSPYFKRHGWTVIGPDVSKINDIDSFVPSHWLEIKKHDVTIHINSNSYGLPYSVKIDGIYGSDREEKKFRKYDGNKIIKAVGYCYSIAKAKQIAKKEILEIQDKELNTIKDVLTKIQSNFTVEKNTESQCSGYGTRNKRFYDVTCFIINKLVDSKKNNVINHLTLRIKDGIFTFNVPNLAPMNEEQFIKLLTIF